MLRFLSAPTAISKALKPSRHEAIIDRFSPKVSRDFIGATERAQERIDLNELEALIEARRVPQILQTLGIDIYTTDDLGGIAPVIVQAYRQIVHDAVAKDKDKPSTIVVDGRPVRVVLNPTDKRSRYRLVEVDIPTIDQGWAKSPSFYLNAEGENRIGQRYQRVGDFLQTAKEMEAPSLHVTSDGAVMFGDGRHRFAYLRDHGVTKIPVAMTHEGELNAIKNGMIIAPSMPVGGPLGISLDVTNPKAVAAAERQAATLLSSVNSETKQTVRDLIARAYRDQITSKDTARLIRDVVGLNNRQSTALYNYRAGLVEDGRAADQVERMTEKYGNKLLRQRADTIAQTEIHRASAEGQHEIWREGVREGRIDPTTARRIWIANAGACEWCEGIESINADGVPIDGQFETPDGDMIDGPEESHVSCRCSTGLETE